MGEEHVVTFVPGLLSWCRPATIVRLIALVVIDPLDGGLAWRFAHVGKEILEAAPALTEANPAAAVACEVDMLGILAAILDVQPNAVDPRAGFAVSAVGLALGNAEFVPQAAAGFGFAAEEIRGGCDFCVSAVAQAAPQRVTDFVGTSWLGDG